MYQGLNLESLTDKTRVLITRPIKRFTCHKVINKKGNKTNRTVTAGDM